MCRTYTCGFTNYSRVLFFSFLFWVSMVIFNEALSLGPCAPRMRGSEIPTPPLFVSGTFKNVHGAEAAPPGSVLALAYLVAQCCLISTELRSHVKTCFATLASAKDRDRYALCIYLARQTSGMVFPIQEASSTSRTTPSHILATLLPIYFLQAKRHLPRCMHKISQRSLARGTLHRMI